MSLRNSTEHAAECLYRLAEFRAWVSSNVLFPLVPDATVDPLVASLLEAEHRLVCMLYESGQLDAVTAMIKAMSSPQRSMT